MGVHLMLKLTLLTLSGFIDVFAADCTFNLDTSSPKYPPHLVDLKAKKIIQPVLVNGARIITVALNQQVTVACEGPGNFLYATGTQTATATCTSASATRLSIGTKSFAYNDLGCKAQPEEKLQKNGGCEMGGTIVEIGWQVANEFIPQITVCHVNPTANTLYSIHTIYGKNMAANDKAHPRHNRYYDDFMLSGIGVNTAYTKDSQINTIGSAITITSSSYLERGHLSPDGDFIDGASQDASYYFINVAPQWKSFNNGNWKETEKAIRNVASARQKDFVIYTGTYDILKLGNPQRAIYLTKDVKTNKNVIPVPKYSWKVVHDPAAKQAVAIIGINNPFISALSPNDVFCTDVCSQIKWLDLKDRTQFSKGYTFCCTVQDFRKDVAYAPNLNLPLLV